MALHIMGFFLCKWLIDVLGLGNNMSMAATLYTYRTETNVLLAAMYLLFGVGFPLVTMYIYDRTKELTLHAYSSIKTHLSE